MKGLENHHSSSPFKLVAFAVTSFTKTVFYWTTPPHIESHHDASPFVSVAACLSHRHSLLTSFNSLIDCSQLNTYPHRVLETSERKLRKHVYSDGFPLGQGLTKHWLNFIDGMK